MNLNPFIDLVASAISLYTFLLIGWIIVSWLISFDIINRYSPFVQRAMHFLARITDPLLNPIRKVVPPIASVDISPIILFLILNFVRNALYTYFYV